MRFITSEILAEPIWGRVVSGWHDDLANWLRSKLPPIVVILIVAVILTRLLGLITRKLQQFSNREELPSRIRAQQLRTIAAVIHSVGIFIIYFLALLQILEKLDVNVGPFLPAQASPAWPLVLVLKLLSTTSSMGSS